MPYTTETMIDLLFKKNDSIDLGKRHDGRWNIWRRFLVVEKNKQDSYWGWHVVGVVSSYKFGVDVVDFILKNKEQATREMIEEYVSSNGYD